MLGCLLKFFTLQTLFLRTIRRIGGALHARIKALEYLKKTCENFVEEDGLQYGIAKAKEN